MKNLLLTLLNLLFALIGGLARFLRVPCTLPTPAEVSPALPAAAPSALSEIEAQLDAQIAEFDQWEREYNREQRAYRKLLRDQARARGELPPPKPRQRKPRTPSPPPPPRTQAELSAPLPAPPRALPTLPAAPSLPPAHPQAPNQSRFSLRLLSSPLSKALITPWRMVQRAFLALPPLLARFLPRFFWRRPPSDGPPSNSSPSARPTAPPLQNRAA